MNIWAVLLISLLFEAYSSLSITAGSSHTCALSDLRAAKCWGRNSKGQLGIGDANDRGDAPNEMGNNLPEIDLGNEFNIVLLKAGYYHTCAVSDNATVKCWGWGYKGALGQGSTQTIGDMSGEMGNNLHEIELGVGFKVIDMALGFHFSCALSENATVKCWGHNSNGQVSIGSFEDIGDEANEMGNNLNTLDLGNDFFVISLAASQYGVCALSDIFTVKCWGRGYEGQLGTGSITSSILNEIDLGNGFGVVSIAAHSGSSHYCALSNVGSVKCWGYNNEGQLGLGDTNNRGDEPNEMGNNLPILDLGNDFNVTSIYTGVFHSCAVSNEGKIKCWGRGDNGQLGTESTTNIGDTSGQMGNNLAVINLGNEFDIVSSMALGGWHTCAVSYAGKVKCFGYNNYGQLGLGDKVKRGDVANTMNDNLPVINLDFTTQNPSQNPTQYPTQNTQNPTQNPSVPSQNPTQNPTQYPTQNTQNPTQNPANDETNDISNIIDSNVYLVIIIVCAVVVINH